MMLSTCVLWLFDTAYDPNEEDVFSFMDIFDSNKDGQI